MISNGMCFTTDRLLIKNYIYENFAEQDYKKKAAVWSPDRTENQRKKQPN